MRAACQPDATDAIQLDRCVLKRLQDTEDYQVKSETMAALYHTDGSAPCRAVRMLAKEIGVELELRNLDIFAGDNMKPEFLEVGVSHLSLLTRELAYRRLHEPPRPTHVQNGQL